MSRDKKRSSGTRGGKRSDADSIDSEPFESVSVNISDLFADSAAVEAFEMSERKAKRPRHPPIAQRIARIPLLTPRQIDERIIELGYRGQAHARRAGAVLAYRHLQRLRRVYLQGKSLSNLPQRENYLFVGPTGCGKTYLVELLFNEILRVPTIIADITQYSETGYVGDDVNMLISRLYEQAEQDLVWASCGIVCIDEFDKLATSRSSARFAGEGTTKDVSGFGVQRSLLSLLSASEANFPVDFGYAHLGPKLSMPLDHITFIACGAFSGLKATADMMSQEERIGFGRTSAKLEQEAIAVDLDDTVLEQTSAFSRYGILPELVGRFSRLIAFKPLSRDILRQILMDNVVKSYIHEFELEGFELSIDDAVINRIISKAEKRQTGARGLRASLVPYLEDAAYDVFGSKKGKVVSLSLNGDDIHVEIT